MLLLDPEARPLIGHRGASGDYPENTLLAFDQALRQGADALELDVRLTADEAVVVMHDASVDRTTDGTGLVGAMRLESLRALDAGRGERVPTLTEVLSRYPATPLIVEIKERRAAQPTTRLLVEHGAAGRVLVGAFERAALRPFAGAGIQRSAARWETGGFWLAARIGLAVGGRYAAFTVPPTYGRLRVVDPRFVRAARRRRKPVHVWTVDDPEEARRLRAIGVAGLITNAPARLRALG